RGKRSISCTTPILRARATPLLKWRGGTTQYQLRARKKRTGVAANRCDDRPKEPLSDTIRSRQSGTDPDGARETVDEDTFNMSVRKFLKTLGVTAQREIELTVREQL